MTQEEFFNIVSYDFLPELARREEHYLQKAEDAEKNSNDEKKNYYLGKAHAFKWCLNKLFDIHYDAFKDLDLEDDKDEDLDLEDDKDDV